MDIKTKNLKGQIMIMKTLGMKPNYTEIGRSFGKDRHTVKKYYEGYEGKSKTRKKSSKLDKHYEEIKTKISIMGSNQIGVYQYLFDKDNSIGTYSNFKKYLTKHNIKPGKSQKVHLRFETDPGEQLQVDWKEDIKMINKRGEVYEFNIFTTTLGMSRLHNFVYSKNKTREDVQRCIISTLKYINGIPKHILTDNMTTIMDILGKEKKVNNEFLQFAKDMGFEVKACKVRSPQTKGKDETANKFMTWLIPYNNEFENEEDLIKIIESIRDRVNSQVHQTTGIPPILLFEKEKEYLKSLPSKKIMDSYLVDAKKIKVSCESLIYYKGKKYSVSPKYIDLFVSVKQINDILYIYHNKDLIATHEITKKLINYEKDHYIEGLYASIKNKGDCDIDKMAEDNLKRLDNLLEG